MAKSETPSPTVNSETPINNEELKASRENLNVAIERARQAINTSADNAKRGIAKKGQELREKLRNYNYNQPADLDTKVPPTNSTEPANVDSNQEQTATGQTKYNSTNIPTANPGTLQTPTNQPLPGIDRDNITPAQGDSNDEGGFLRQAVLQSQIGGKDVGTYRAKTGLDSSEYLATPEGNARFDGLKSITHTSIAQAQIDVTTEMLGSNALPSDLTSQVKETKKRERKVSFGQAAGKVAEFAVPAIASGLVGEGVKQTLSGLFGPLVAALAGGATGLARAGLEINIAGRSEQSIFKDMSVNSLIQRKLSPDRTWNDKETGSIRKFFAGFSKLINFGDYWGARNAYVSKDRLESIDRIIGKDINGESILDKSDKEQYAHIAKMISNKDSDNLYVNDLKAMMSEYFVTGLAVKEKGKEKSMFGIDKIKYRSNSEIQKAIQFMARADYVLGLVTGVQSQKDFHNSVKESTNKIISDGKLTYTIWGGIGGFAKGLTMYSIVDTIKSHFFSGKDAVISCTTTDRSYDSLEKARFAKGGNINTLSGSADNWQNMDDAHKNVLAQIRTEANGIYQRATGNVNSPKFLDSSVDEIRAYYDLSKGGGKAALTGIPNQGGRLGDLGGLKETMNNLAEVRPIPFNPDEFKAEFLRNLTSAAARDGIPVEKYVALVERTRRLDALTKIAEELNNKPAVMAEFEKAMSAANEFGLTRDQAFKAFTLRAGVGDIDRFGGVEKWIHAIATGNREAGASLASTVQYFEGPGRTFTPEWLKWFPKPKVDIIPKIPTIPNIDPGKLPEYFKRWDDLPIPKPYELARVPDVTDIVGKCVDDTFDNWKPWSLVDIAKVAIPSLISIPGFGVGNTLYGDEFEKVSVTPEKDENSKEKPTEDKKTTPRPENPTPANVTSTDPTQTAEPIRAVQTYVDPIKDVTPAKPKNNDQIIDVEARLIDKSKLGDSRPVINLDQPDKIDEALKLPTTQVELTQQEYDEIVNKRNPLILDAIITNALMNPDFIKYLNTFGIKPTIIEGDSPSGSNEIQEELQRLLQKYGEKQLENLVFAAFAQGKRYRGYKFNAPEGGKETY